MAKDYNAINFKNKDIDKFATRFGQGDPEKGIVSQAKDAMNTIAKTPRSKGTIDFYTEYNPKSLESIPMSMDTTGLASGKQNFRLRSGTGKIIGNVDNEQAKALVKKIESGTLPKRKTGK
jgi:hypothetical protein